MDRLRTTGEDLSNASIRQFNEFWGKEERKSPSGWVNIEEIADTTTPNPEEAMLIAEAEKEAESREEVERFINALSGKINDSVADVLDLEEEGEEESVDAEISEYTGSPKHSGMIVGSRRAVQSKMF